MPCRDYDDERQRDHEVRQRLDKVTRLLCGVMKGLEEGTRLTQRFVTPELREWWEAHKAADRKEAEKQARVKAAAARELRDRIAKDQAKLKAIEAALGAGTTEEGGPTKPGIGWRCPIGVPGCKAPCGDYGCGN